MINETKDACYHKVKSRYSVWPSAYASGALVKCRKKGAKNWGNSRKDEALHTAYFNFAVSLLERDEFGDPTMGGLKKSGPKPKMTIDPDTGKLTPKKTKTGSTTMTPGEDRPTPDAKSVKRNQSSEPPLLRGRNRREAERDAAAILQKERDRDTAMRVIRTGSAEDQRSDPNRPSTGSEEEGILQRKRKEAEKAKEKKDQRGKELRQRLKDKQASEREARAAARGTTRRKIDYDVKVNPKTGEKEVVGKKRGGLRGSYLGRLTRAKTQQAMDSPVKALKALKRATIGSPTSAIKAGRAAMKARRERIDFSTEYQKIGSIIAEKSAAWTRSEGKNPSGGLNAKGVASYRANNPGSKLKTAVTTKPSKLKKGSKAAKRRMSFCARMKGMRARQKSSNNTGKDRLSLSLKKWNC